MERMTAASTPILAGGEEEGRWWAGIEHMPAVMACGATRESAIGRRRS